MLPTRYIVTSPEEWAAIKSMPIACRRTKFSETQHEFKAATVITENITDILPTIHETPHAIVVISETQLTSNAWRYFLYYGVLT